MITASVVLFNTKVADIQQIIASYKPSKERLLFFYDNSVTKNKEYFFLLEIPNVVYINNRFNLGYGAAHNLAIEKSIKMKAKYHLVLNPDLIFEPEVIDILTNYANAHEDVIYILPKVIYPNGEIQYLCKLLPTPFDSIFRRFFPKVGSIKKMDDKYVLKDSGYNKIINPPCLSGCFMLMRTSSLSENNIRFDERFFMYFEDFDLIRRLHRVGKTIYYPYVTIIHNHAKESYKNHRALMIHIKSACLYFNKYGWFFDKERRKMNNEIKYVINKKDREENRG